MYITDAIVTQPQLPTEARYEHLHSLERAVHIDEESSTGGFRAPLCVDDSPGVASSMQLRVVVQTRGKRLYLYRVNIETQDTGAIAMEKIKRLYVQQLQYPPLIRSLFFVVYKTVVDVATLSTVSAYNDYYESELIELRFVREVLYPMSA
jgi:hypothetical protein